MKTKKTIYEEFKISYDTTVTAVYVEGALQYFRLQSNQGNFHLNKEESLALVQAIKDTWEEK